MSSSDTLSSVTTAVKTSTTSTTSTSGRVTDGAAAAASNVDTEAAQAATDSGTFTMCSTASCDVANLLDAGVTGSLTSAVGAAADVQLNGKDSRREGSSLSSSDSESRHTLSLLSQQVMCVTSVSEQDGGESAPEVTVVTAADVGATNGLPDLPPTVELSIEVAGPSKATAVPTKLCSKHSSKKASQVSPKEKVDAWLSQCLNESTISNGLVGENASNDVASLEQEECDTIVEDENDDNNCTENDEMDFDDDLEDICLENECLRIQELLTEGCKILNIEDDTGEQSGEKTEAVECHDADISPSSPIQEKDPDNETSSSETSSFCISPENIKRSASLKSGKTPPGTPSRKKFVRFADAMGLELQQIRTFKDEIPVIPASAYRALDQSRANAWMFTFESTMRQCSRRLQPQFLPPTATPGFMERLHRNKVLLESVHCREEDSSVRCIVRVLNISFEKFVRLRFSMDEWSTWSERAATYLAGSSDGETDRFQTVLYCSTLSAGQRLQLAVAFYCGTCEYWDNNDGRNYIIQCVFHSDNHGQQSPEEWTGGQM